MGIFDLDTSGQQTLAEQARFNPIDVSNLSPSFSTGLARGIGEGVMRGGARAAEFIGMATAAAPVALYDRFAGTEGADAMFRVIDDHIHNAVDYWTPTANEVGTAGRVLGGLSEMVLPLMAGGGNPSLMIGSQEMGGSKDLVSQGASPGAAVAAGTVEGLSTAVGFKIPFLGKTLASKLASGAGGNLAVNAGSSAVEQQILKRTGNEAQSEQFSPFNAEARAVDVLTGLAFGGIAHGTRVKPSERDAILTAANAKHFQSDTAPGVPADATANVAHQDAIEVALRDLLEGNPVEVGKTGVQNAHFTPRPAEGSPTEIPPELKALDRSEPSSAIPRDQKLGPAERAIESQFAVQLESDVQGAMRDYAKLSGSENGKILNTDLARELSPDYRADRTRSAAVHEPASWLVKEMYAKNLAEPLKPGEEPIVVMSAGGTGAGKTTGFERFLQDSPVLKQAQIIYDTNMNGLESSAKKIDQALNAGKDVAIVYTYRDPVDALVKGALPRAMRMGRTVPLEEHAKTHVGAANTIKALSEKYKGDPRVSFMVADNSHGKGQVRKGNLADVPALEYNKVHEDLRKALEEQRQAGAISEAVYRGTAGPEASLKIERSGHRGGDHQGDEQSPGSVLSTDPTVSAAHQAIAEADFPVPTGEINPDGSVQTISARELLAKARLDVIQAEHDSKAFEAIAGCILTRGSG